MRFEDVRDIVERHVQSDVPQNDAIFLKEPRLYCFLLYCKRREAQPFMEWAVQTVLPREVRKLQSVIEEKDAALALLTDNLQDRDNQIKALEFTHQQEVLRLNEESDDLIANRHVARRGWFDNVLCFTKKNSKEVHPHYVI